MWTRQGHKAGSVRASSADWRITLKRTHAVAAVLLGVWAVGIEARLVYLQVFEHAELVARAARQQQRTIVAPPSGATSSIATAACWPPVPTPTPSTPCPRRSRTKRRPSPRSVRRFADCTAASGRRCVDRLGKQRAFAYVRRQVSPDVARRVAALNLDGIGFLKESRRFYPNGELAAHVLGFVGIDNNGLGGIEAAYDSADSRQGRQGARADRCAGSQAFNRFERPPTAGLVARADDRRVSAARRRTRAARRRRREPRRAAGAPSS